MKKRIWTKAALALSVCLMILWWILGAGATIAWFTDTTPPVRNTFRVGLMDLDVSYKNQDMTDYAPVLEDTAVFDDEALYEPGYTQVVYLKIENPGNVEFEYKLSVDVVDVVTARGVLGNEIYLPNYLRFGVVFADSEEELERETARAIASLEMADHTLNTYSAFDTVSLGTGDARYAALVVYMPEEVGNAANYRGTTAPAVKLGLTVFAQQAGTPME